jgi:tRNA A-37 threonylcarbamoyl transferase component Bud32
MKNMKMDSGNLIVNRRFLPILEKNGLTSAQALWNMKSTPVKAVVAERGTGRFFLSSHSNRQKIEVYIKRYLPAPYREKIRNILSLKRCFCDAFHEWNAINLFHRHNLPTMTPIAVARVGNNTCNLTLGIKKCQRASELLAEKGRLDTTERMILLENIANTVGKMHALGMAHQDMYLLHIFVRKPERIFLIDLQRTIIQKRLSTRWIVKDLAQFIFSASGIISDKEMSHFMTTYTDSFFMHSRRKIDMDYIFEASARKARRIARRHARKMAKDRS